MIKHVIVARDVEEEYCSAFDKIRRAEIQSAWNSVPTLEGAWPALNQKSALITLWRYESRINWPHYLSSPFAWGIQRVMASAILMTS